MNKTQFTTYWQSLPWNEIKPKVNKHLPTFIFVLLIILLTQTLAELTWELFTPTQKSASSVLNTSNSRVKTSPNKTNLKEVSTFHLFGDAKKQPAVKQQVIDAPETRLRLELKGVFASSNAEEALAIISSSKGQDKTYKIGDKVKGGALLHAVYADRVILKRNGKLETLRLPKSKVDSKSFYSRTNNRRSKSEEDDEPPRRVSSNRSQTQHLRKMRETLLKDPSKIWKKIRINPVMKNGEVQGYTLVHNDPKVMKALKLRSSDIITAVNGQSLSDPATLYGLMGSLADQPSLEFSIERNGQPQIIQLSF